MEDVEARIAVLGIEHVGDRAGPAGVRRRGRGGRWRWRRLRGAAGAQQQDDQCGPSTHMRTLARVDKPYFGVVGESSQVLISLL
ncbi:hypothetical protein GCM10010443_88100 [Actinoplanes cyaneus]